MPLAKIGDIEIAYADLGPITGAAVLLIPGAGRQLIDWDEALTEAITRAGRRVVAADLRDAGCSTHLTEAGKARLVPPWESRPAPEPAYGLTDMAADMVGLLDALRIERAHLVGASLGAAVAQVMAAGHPERAVSLTCIASSTGAPGIGPPSAAGKRALSRGPGDEPAAEAETVLLTEAGIGNIDPDEAHERAASAVRRSHDPAATGRQLAALWGFGDRTALLETIGVPTLVIHGSADAVVDPSGGRATAGAVPGARLRIIEGMGHLITGRHAVGVVSELLRHFASAEARA